MTIVAITGTPGTGKTTIARLLHKKLKNSKIISIKSLSKKCSSEYDKDRRCWIVDIKKLQKTVLRMIKNTPTSNKQKLYIIDGHLSHLINFDIIILLRCNPKTLEKRLKKKGWSQKKIRENIEAEMVDVIKAEVLKTKRKYVEIDTTKKTPKKITNKLMKILKD
ncbi:MAG: AAA family ATPase [Candidatus Aenigmatarchaeota archaeon]